MLLYLTLFALLNVTNVGQTYEIQDIPVENFEHADVANDDFDVELMPKISAQQIIDSRRVRRKADQGKSDDNGANIDLVKDLGSPLELTIIDPENTSKSVSEASTNASERNSQEESNFLINDFIRFKRSCAQDGLNEIGSKEKNTFSENYNRTARDTSDRIVSAEQRDNGREPRGATKEQWSKQAYTVRKDVGPIPRVDFVTQGMSDSESGTRVRNLYRDRGLARDLFSEMDYLQPRYINANEPLPYRRPSRYYDPYYSHSDLDSRTSRQSYPYGRPYENYPNQPRNDYNSNRRQRRIIYYATLPEVSRASPNLNSRERYNYRHRDYEDYPVLDHHKGYVKPKYEERLVDKYPFPAKVSTDVHVREVKKIPEKRIYSDIDRMKN